MLFEIFLQFQNGFDLSADSLLVERLAVFEMSQMPSDANNFDMSFRQLPKLIFFQDINVFCSFRSSLL